MQAKSRFVQRVVMREASRCGARNFPVRAHCRGSCSPAAGAAPASVRRLRVPFSSLKRRRNSCASSATSSRTVAQRRQQDRDDIDAVIKIGAEFAALHRRFEIPVGGENKAHVHLDRLRAADALELAFLQHAQQLGLEGRRNLADLVEKQRALVGQFEAALALADAPGERALLMTEQFGFQHAIPAAPRSSAE